MKKNQLKSGVVLSYINLALSSVIPILYTPVMLQILGQSEYGLYSLANSVVGYLSLLNFGIGSTVVRYLTKCRAQNDRKGEERMLGLFVVIYSALTLLVLIVGTICALNCGLVYSAKLTREELSRMQLLIFLMTVNTAITFLFSAFTSVVLAHERYIFKKLTEMLSTVLAPCMNLLMLFMGFASVGLVIATTIVHLLMYGSNLFYCLRVLKIRPRFKNMPFGIMKELVAFSAFVFLGMVGDMLYWATDKLIIGAMIGTAAVAVYNVGATFNTIVTSVSSAISGVLTPRITNMVFTDCSKKELTDIFIRVGRLQYILVSFIISAFIVFGQQFIRLWAGEAYAQAYPVALLTLVPILIPLIQNTGISIVIAQNKHRFRSVMYAVIAVVNAVSTVFAVQYFGIIGAAACSCAAYILGNGLIMNWYYYKKTGINIPLFWRNILKMSPVAVGMTLLGLFATRYFSIDSWGRFFLGAIVYTLLFVPLAYFLMMNQYERNMVRDPVIKLKNKLFKKEKV